MKFIRPLCPGGALESLKRVDDEWGVVYNGQVLNALSERNEFAFFNLYVNEAFDIVSHLWTNL